MKENLDLDDEKEDVLSNNLAESDPSFIVQGFFNGFNDISYNTFDDEEIRKAIRLEDLTAEAMIKSVVGTLSQLEWDKAEKEYTL